MKYLRKLICGILFFPAILPAQKTQNCLNFDGVNDYVTLDSLADDMNGLTSFTVEFWMLADKNAQTSAIRVDMFAVNEPAFNGDNTFLLSMGGMNAQDGKLIVFDGITAFDIVSSTVVGNNTCHHIAYVRNGAQGTLYIDGILAGTHVADYAFTPNNRYSLGQEWDNATPSDFYNGELDEFRIWNIARSQSDILSTMNNSLFGNEPGLVAYYQFNQGITNGPNPTVTSLLDGSPVGNGGTLHNFALNGTVSNWTTFCMNFTIGIGEENAGQAFELFPVPATEQLTLRGNFAAGTKMEIRDVAGRLLFEEMIVTTESIVDIRALAAGIYFIRVGETTQRFQKIN